MKFLLLVALASSATAATDSTPWPTGNRTTPPTINMVSPLGIARGTTAEVIVEGLNLAQASAIYFSQAGVAAKIVRIKELPDQPDMRLGANGGASTVDLGPLPPRNQVALELTLSPDANIGPVEFRLHTPLGTTPEARIVIEPKDGETLDREPNETPAEAVEAKTPTILVGRISRPGDVDYYKIHIHAGEQLTFYNSGPLLGSPLQPVITIYDAAQRKVKEFGRAGGMDTVRFACTFENEGDYYVRVSDFQNSGNAGRLYRIAVGHYPLLLSAYPLGVTKDKATEVTLRGYNLGMEKFTVSGLPAQNDSRSVSLRPHTASGDTFNELRLALGEGPEVESSGTNTTTAKAQDITGPMTINGRLLAAENNFRFRARKGEKLVFETNARRLGSPLDSVLEVMDAAGKPVERATVRCLAETFTTLSDRDSATAGLRFLSTDGYRVGDYTMIGGEIIQVQAMPRGPDDDMQYVSFEGQRIGMWDTTPEAHAIDTPVYRVKIFPPGQTFAPNGLPVAHLAYSNDDGGPGYGKDSHLPFTAPADGVYVLRLRDIRGFHGEDYAYRLSIRPPQPDFGLSARPTNPNVPEGGRIPVTITALRLDDFDGAIEIKLEGLPSGLHATKGIIEPGQVNTTILLSADVGARLERAVPLQIIGRATIGTRLVAHRADPEDPLQLVALMPKPDITMTAETKKVVVAPGGTATVEVSIQRHNSFAGRVPIDVRNLPPGVLVTDVGLNGVLINENESRRTFKIEALPTATPITQPLILSGEIETRADGQQTAYAAEAVILEVKPQLSPRSEK
ncbi:MAG: hypothetical protein ABI693_17035 [Bryobacteraceae bacterium]